MWHHWAVMQQLKKSVYVCMHGIMLKYSQMGNSKPVFTPPNDVASSPKTKKPHIIFASKARASPSGAYHVSQL
jgi:hypothetical protein